MKQAKFRMISMAVVYILFVSCSLHEHEASPTGDLKQAEFVQDSIYQLGSRMMDQNGHEVSLDMFRGSPVLVSMFFATCPHACPLLISKIKQVESELNSKSRKRVRVLMISFDPDRDTPKVLSDLAARHKVDEDRWRFATPSAEQIRAIAAVLGIKYRKLPDGDFNHSSEISLLDQEGVIQIKIDAFTGASENLIQHLQSL